ncbi:MAG TPA: zinc-dependent alcohol dehydrogenase family protein [Anaerolineaceae bacterium]|jgi:alcohol dehydrogenase, propanol-preferring
MKAMILNQIAALAENPNPLLLVDLPTPQPGQGQILIRVSACAVCHTELDEIEGRMPPPRLPVVPGHQVVGRVEIMGSGAGRFHPGDRVGVGWIFSSCGDCGACRNGNENLCPEFHATGRDANGGYAEYMVIGEQYAAPIPDVFSDLEAAPLLCAGAVGYRALRLANLQDGQHLGLTGFGGSNHLVLQLARYLYPRSRIFVFARSQAEQEFALSLGAAWAGDPTQRAPRRLNAIIDTTPAWQPVLEALRSLAPGGRLVINAIRKEEVDKNSLLSLDYATHLWMEKEIKTIANVTRRDITDFLALAAQVPIRPQVQVYPLEQANQALCELKDRKIRGAKVLSITL